MKNLVIAFLFLVAVFTGGCSVLYFISGLGQPALLAMAFVNLAIAAVCIAAGRALTYARPIFGRDDDPSDQGPTFPKG